MHGDVARSLRRSDNKVQTILSFFTTCHTSLSSLTASGHHYGEGFKMEYGKSIGTCRRCLAEPKFIWNRANSPVDHNTKFSKACFTRIHLCRSLAHEQYFQDITQNSKQYHWRTPSGYANPVHYKSEAPGTPLGISKFYLSIHDSFASTTDNSTMPHCIPR